MTIEVLSITSEAVPLVKTGGLADVAGALPSALAPFDVNMRTLLPAYPAVKTHAGEAKSVMDIPELFGGAAKVLDFDVNGTRFLALDAPHLFDREGGLYIDKSGRDFPDNPQRFAALSYAAALIAESGLDDGWRPQVMHMHDWQTGLAAYYLRARGRASIPSLITVHNIAFQGVVSGAMRDELHISEWDFHPDGLEYFGNISTLKAGLVYANKITTVSPTYANELKTPAFGMGLDGVIRGREADILGILNGVDLNTWSPETGKSFHKYSKSRLANKAKNRADLIEEFGLSEMSGPLAILVSRLTHQKGIDLLLENLPAYFAAGGGLVLLGSGDFHYENQLRELQAAYPEHFGLHIGYDEALSQRLFAGGDAVLVPSRFEPCGLTQLYGLRFGTLPVVAETGGLADTVIHANDAAVNAGVATGITFSRIDSAGCRDALTRLVTLYADKTLWKKMQKNAMSQDVSWARSAEKYAALYRSLVDGNEE